MLLSSGTLHGEQTSDLATVHNYYERLVFDALHHQLPERLHDSSYIADVACVALNHLPPRYIRHDVDMAFYLSPDEREEMEAKADRAVNDAIAFVDSRADAPRD